MGATKRIYVMRTQAAESKLYEMRNELYDVGVRWDARRKRWWAPKLALVRRAAELVGDAEAEGIHVRMLPKIADTFRGGRPRKPRKTLAKVESVSASLPPIIPLGAPTMRQTSNPERRAGEADRRSADRRNVSTRPDAVLVVPVALPNVQGSITELQSA